MASPDILTGFQSLNVEAAKPMLHVPALLPILIVLAMTSTPSVGAR
ncbi:MAG: hypothetical protein ACYC2W_04280 [Desulfurivibrionaceae bacterium]